MSSRQEEIDVAILGSSEFRWQKMAMVLARAKAELDQTHPGISFDEIAERIYGLIREGKLLGIGELTLWRKSEVRLPSD